MHALSGAVLLNRYSKLLKLLSMSHEWAAKLEAKERVFFIETELFLAKSFMSYQLERMKIQYQMGNTMIEAGIMVLVDLLH